MFDVKDELHTADYHGPCQYQNQQYNIMDSPGRKSLNGSSAHTLRVINILTFIPGSILISALIKPAGALYLIPAAPLTLSALLGLVCVAGKNKDRPIPWWASCADLFLAMFYLGILIPMYVFTALLFAVLAGYIPQERNVCCLSFTDDLFFAIVSRWMGLTAIGNFHPDVCLDMSVILLGAYSTMPLIVDLYVSTLSLSLSLSPDLVNKTCKHIACYILQPHFTHQC